MGTIKLDKDEMLKIAGQLSVLKEEINYILNKLSETENVLRRENSVSTYSQKRKLSDLQDLAFNLVREFDKSCDNFYAAARAVESFEDDIMNGVFLYPVEKEDKKNIPKKTLKGYGGSIRAEGFVIPQNSKDFNSFVREMKKNFTNFIDRVLAGV